MRSPATPTRPLITADWGASDALMLEGLNGLQEQVAAAASDPGQSAGISAVAPQDSWGFDRDSLHDSSVSQPQTVNRISGSGGLTPGTGAARATDGERASDARFGLSQRFIEEAPPVEAPENRVARDRANVQDFPLISKPVGHPETVEESDWGAPASMPQQEPEAPSPRQAPRKRRRRRERIAKRSSSPADADADDNGHSSARSRVPEDAMEARVIHRTETHQASPERQPQIPPIIADSYAAPAEAAEEESEPARTVTPQMETTVRRRRTTSSFVPSVVTSLLLTSLIWGSILFTFWNFVGDEWFSERIQEDTLPLKVDLTDQLRQKETKISDNVLDVQEELVVLRASYEQFVRLNALEASMYADHSRQKFDDLVQIGRRLETGSSEEEFFNQTKKRIETAYNRRLRQHPGLNVKALFPEINAGKESAIAKTKLMDFVSLPDPKVNGWDRARGAVLLRRFADDEKVIAKLIQVIRDEQDLQVMFAAWDSLVALTGYETGSKGFSPTDFDRWWSTRHR